MPRTSAPPLSPIEQQHIANRLDNGGDCSRHESMRLLATLREMQTKASPVHMHLDSEQSRLMVEDAIERLNTIGAWVAEARPWVQDDTLRNRINHLVPPRKRPSEGEPA